MMQGFYGLSAWLFYPECETWCSWRLLGCRMAETLFKVHGRWGFLVIKSGKIANRLCSVKAGVSTMGAVDLLIGNQGRRQSFYRYFAAQSTAKIKKLGIVTISPD